MSLFCSILNSCDRLRFFPIGFKLCWIVFGRANLKTTKFLFALFGCSYMLVIFNDYYGDTFIHAIILIPRFCRFFVRIVTALNVCKISFRAAICNVP